MSVLLESAELEVDDSHSTLAFERDGGGWDRYLTLDGARAYYLGNSCDTCNFVFGRLEGAGSKVSPAEVGSVLRAGVGRLEDVLPAARRAVPNARYRALLLEIGPTLVRPGDEGDYFRAEQVELWPVDSASEATHDPRTAYYRAGSSDLGDWKRLFEFVVPLAAPASLDGSTVAGYEERLASGDRPTALALSVLEVRGPADWEGEPDVVEHWCLAHYLLDGHHKLAASARAGRPVTLLSFLALDEGLAKEQDVERVLVALAR